MTASDVLTLRSSEQQTAVLTEDLLASTKRCIVNFGFVRLDNIASQRVVTRAGGVLTERFTKLPQNGGGEALRFRIDL